MLPKTTALLLLAALQGEFAMVLPTAALLPLLGA
jgi:hypothetical protein